VVGVTEEEVVRREADEVVRGAAVAGEEVDREVEVGVGPEGRAAGAVAVGVGLGLETAGVGAESKDEKKSSSAPAVEVAAAGSGLMLWTPSTKIWSGNLRRAKQTEMPGQTSSASLPRNYATTQIQPG
jgi:hypothetical protein